MVNIDKYRRGVLRSASALLLGAGALAAVPAGSSAQESAETETPRVLFEVENLQPADGFFATPVWTGLHGGDFDLFNEGERASAGLEEIAETGSAETLSAEFEAPGRLQTVVGDAPIGPGDTIEGSIDIINPAAYRYMSFASMIIPSNDGFFGNGDPVAYELFDAEGNFTGPVTIDIYGEDIYDSGTEVNNGSGAAGFSLGFDGEGSGDSTDDPSGTVAPHPDLFSNLVGLQTAAGTEIGSDGSGAIETDEPVARITVTVEGVPASDDGVQGIYSLRNVDLGGYLALSDGDNVVTRDTASDETQWEVITDGDYVYFRSVANGEFLDADRRANNVDTNRSTDANGTEWELIDAGNGETVIRNVDFDRFLDADKRANNVDTNRRSDVTGTEWELVAVENDVVSGAVFVGTNDLENNTIAAFARGADGTLSSIGEFETGGQGSTEFDGGEGLDPLISADSVIVTDDEQYLLTVNAGSDTITSFRINDDFTLEQISVVDSGGVGPNSLAVDGNHVFVTNIDRDGLALGEAGTLRAEPNDEGNVVGFYLSEYGELKATGYSADLDNRPANIDFSTDGDRLIVSSITSGSAALPGANAEASVYSFDIASSGELTPADTNTSTERNNSEGRNLPSAIDFDITVQGGREFVVVTEAREFNSEGAPPALPALQAGSVTVYELEGDSSLTITEGDFAFTDGDPSAPNQFGANGQQLTACWIDFGHGEGADIFYVSNAINATISSVRLADDGSLEIIESIAAAGTSGFAEAGVVVDGPTTFGATDGFIDLDVSPDGNFLYQLEGLSGNIGVYAVDGYGGLEQVQELSGELPEIDTQGIVSVGG